MNKTKKATNNRRVLTAHSRIESAIFHLEFLVKERFIPGKPLGKKKILWGINSALYDLRNAKTILSNTTFKAKDPYGKEMKK